jgi:hypothetical protein
VTLIGRFLEKFCCLAKILRHPLPSVVLPAEIILRVSVSLIGRFLVKFGCLPQILRHALISFSSFVVVVVGLVGVLSRNRTANWNQKGSEQIPTVFAAKILFCRNRSAFCSVA